MNRALKAICRHLGGRHCLRHSLSLALAAPLLLPATTRAGTDDGSALRASAAQLQDLGALLRPQQRRNSGGMGTVTGMAGRTDAGPTLVATLAPNQLVAAAPAPAPAPAPVAAPAPAPAAAPVAAPLAVAAPTPTPTPTPAPTPAPAPLQAATAQPVATPLLVLAAAPDTRPAVPVAAAVVDLPVLHAAAASASPAATAPRIAQAAPAAAAAPQLLAAAPPRAAAAAPVAVAEPRFDLAINNAPAAQVYLQLANGTAYNMLVSPEVSGSLSITLRDTTVPEALDTLRELFGFEYRITGNRIFIYPNTVQTRLYKVNYLPGRRQGASDIRVTSSAIAQSGGGAGGVAGNAAGLAGGSTAGNGGARSDDNAHVRTTSDADFWREVQASLGALVGNAGGRSVVLNPAAGVVVVKATPAELRQVENYLKAVQLSIERQVMLEAKIVEVSLSKDAQTGINWAGFGKLGNGQATIGSAAPGTLLAPTGNLSSADGNIIAPGASLAAGALGRGFYGLAFQAANFGALLNFLETQGNVQVLSSPRIATLNNQKAVLKVGSDELYVTGISSSTTTSGTNAISTPTLTLQPFFSGISLDVTPQIDDAGNVMLHIHPTISTVSEKNKNIDLGSLGAFRLPLAASAVNETDSIVRVRDGQIVAIGGLMKHEMRDEKTGLPVLQDLPGVGAAFRQTGVVHIKRELVIMLKPTIIQEDGPWPDAPTFGGPADQPVRTSAAAAAGTRR